MIRRMSTKEILAASLVELAESRPVDKITVKEIADNCETSTTTFYNHFQDKYDLIAWVYNSQIDALFDKAEVGFDLFEIFHAEAAALADNAGFYANALRNTHGEDSFRTAVLDYSVDAMLVYANSLAEPDGLSDDDAFLLRFYMNGASCALLDWFTSGMGETPERLAELCVKALPLELRPLLARKCDEMR